MIDRFYSRWVLANAWSEGLALSATLLLGLGAAQGLEREPGTVPILLGAVLAVALGTAVEGVVVGLAQGRVLRRRLPALRVRDWTRATAIGAGVAWLLGMVPSTALALAAGPEPAASAGAPSAEPPALVQYALAAAMGLVLGAVLAYPQARALRRFVSRPYPWLAANAVAWGVGMALIFVGMDRAPWGGSVAAIALAVAATCLLAGAAVGAIHGAYLMRLLARMPASGEASGAPAQVGPRR